MAQIELAKPQVTLTSSETLKPSSPTPTNLKTYNLSVLDQSFPELYYNFLMVYNNSTTKSKLDIANLKTSLANTLSRFYPFAGRFENESTISCNDEGIPFSTSRVDCALSDAFSFNSSSGIEFDSFTELLPPADLISHRVRPISEIVPLAFQINEFSCGGVVIGCYILHKVIDGASFGTFIKYWAGLASEREPGPPGDDLLEPVFTAAVNSFPPSTKVDRYTTTGIERHLLAINITKRALVAKCFLFNTHALNDLKAHAASDTVPNPTRFEALGAFLWKHASSAARDAGAVSCDSPTLLRIVANMRSRANPPLPRGSIGNLIANVITKAENLGLPDLAKNIHETMSSGITDSIEVFKGEDGDEAVIADRKALMKEYLGCNPNVYKLSSWSNLGFNEADFGFGKPERIIPFTGGFRPTLGNFFFFNDYSNSTEDGIEVRLILEEKQMQIIESNPVFRALAVPMIPVQYFS